jgi:hypothetical protein
MRKRILKAIGNFLVVSLAVLGLCAAGSDGPYFPWPNLAGLVIVGVICSIVSWREERTSAASVWGRKMKAKEKKKKYTHSRYCEYSWNCDKEIDCKRGNFCSAFKHTTSFTSLRFEGEKHGSR